MTEGFMCQSYWHTPTPPPSASRWQNALPKIFKFGMQDVRFVRAWRCPECKRLELLAE